MRALLSFKVTLAILAATLIAACNAGQPEAAGAAGAGERASVPQAGSPSSAVFHETTPGPDHLTAQAGWDVGTGFVRIRPSPDGPPGSAAADTILLFPEPEDGGGPVARAYHQEGRLVIEATEAGLQDGGLEVGYEERALPVLRAGTDGRWVEASYAFTSNGEQRTGWVDAARPGLELVSWDQWLPGLEAPFFFRSADSIAFFAGPAGASVALDLATGGGSGADYILHPLRTEGEWMEVRVVSPSDYCAFPSSPLEATVWIRFLTPTGRPRVWYFTRGC